MTDSDRAILARAAAWDGLPSLEEANVASLRELTAREGVDFATAVLYDRVVKSARHGPFFRRVEDRLAAPRGRFAGPAPTVVILPGAFFDEFPDSGADGKSIIRQSLRLGLRTAVVPVKSVGRLAENARIILDWVAQCPDPEIILVSTSKGGADLKVALALPGAPRAFRNVVGWINICGILDGTPIANSILNHWWRNFLNWAWFTWMRKDRGFVRELVRTPGAPLDFRLRLPAPWRVVHVAGFPLRAHPTLPLMRRFHKRHSPLGPTDGGLILADLLPLPGTIVPVWSADHYMRVGGQDLGSLAAAILSTLVEDLSPVSQEAPHGHPVTR